MKRFLTLGVVTLVGAGGVAALSEVRELPAALAAADAAADRAEELAALARLRESQRLATDDLVGRLAGGGMTLAEVTDVLESNATGQQVFLNQLAIVRDERTDRERLARFALDRAKEQLGDDPGLQSALVTRVAAETR